MSPPLDDVPPEERPRKTFHLPYTQNNPPPLDPSTQFAADISTFVNRIKQTTPDDVGRFIAASAPGYLSQMRSVTWQASFLLSHPIETRLGTCTVGTAMIHTGLIWTVFCKSHWVAKISTEWRSWSNRPVRALVFVGVTAWHLSPPVPKWDARYYAHKAGRAFKSLAKSIQS